MHRSYIPNICLRSCYFCKYLLCAVAIFQCMNRTQIKIDSSWIDDLWTSTQLNRSCNLHKSVMADWEAYSRDLQWENTPITSKYVEKWNNCAVLVIRKYDVNIIIGCGGCWTCIRSIKCSRSLCFPWHFFQQFLLLFFDMTTVKTVHIHEEVDGWTFIF